jgi:hypothetical protein
MTVSVRYAASRALLATLQLTLQECIGQITERQKMIVLSDEYPIEVTVRRRNRLAVTS